MSKSPALDDPVRLSHHERAGRHELRRQVVQAGDDSKGDEQEADVLRERDCVVVDDTADNATEDKVPDKVDRCQLDRLLLTREAQVEDDQVTPIRSLKTVISKP